MVSAVAQICGQLGIDFSQHTKRFLSIAFALFVCAEEQNTAA